VQPKIETDGIRFEFAAHNCFAGVTLNTNGWDATRKREIQQRYGFPTLDGRVSGNGR